MQKRTYPRPGTHNREIQKYVPIGAGRPRGDIGLGNRPRWHVGNSVVPIIWTTVVQRRGDDGFSKTVLIVVELVEQEKWNKRQGIEQDAENLLGYTFRQSSIHPFIGFPEVYLWLTTSKHPRQDQRMIQQPCRP
jgi:hypothetical protein